MAQSLVILEPLSTTRHLSFTTAVVSFAVSRDSTSLGVTLCHASERWRWTRNPRRCGGPRALAAGWSPRPSRSRNRSLSHRRLPKKQRLLQRQQHQQKTPHQKTLFPETLGDLHGKQPTPARLHKPLLPQVDPAGTQPRKLEKARLLLKSLLKKRIRKCQGF